MTVEYQKVWTTMNDLEMVTSKICSAREIIDNAVDKIQEHQNDKAELLMNAAYEFLEYYLQEFDDKFKLAWQATVGDLRDGDREAYDAVMKERDYYEGKTTLTCDKDDPSPECKGAWNSFWEENYYPEEYKGSTVSSVQYTEEELNAMCDKAASDEEKEKCREYNLREAEYYDKRVKLDAEIEQIRKEGGYDWTPPTTGEKSKYYYEYDRNDPDHPNPFTTDIGTVAQNGVTFQEYRKAQIEANSSWNDGWTKEHYQKIVDKYEGKTKEVKKWVLPVEIDGPSGEYFVQFPDDLLNTANLKEGDQIYWHDNQDGSFTLRKAVESTSKSIESNEC